MIVRNLCRVAWCFALLASCCFCASVPLVAPVSAQNVEQGGTGEGAAGDASEAEEAYKLGLLLDEQGDKDGAFPWYLSAAERGHLEATYRLARAYAEGRGVARNDKLAVPLLQKAADKEHAGAMDGLGIMYFSGRGVAKSARQAEALFQRAAQLGNERALYNLANLYARGSGSVAQNLVAAYVLLEFASQKGINEAQPLMQRVESQLSEEQRLKIDVERAQWKSNLP